MNDGREELRTKLILLLKSKGITNADIEVDIALKDFEIMERTTEITILSEDRNRYLFNKFLAAKLVKGLTERSIEFYQKSLIFIFDRLNKTADNVTTDDIRLYLAIRQKKDKISKTTANNELRVLSTFYKFLQDEEIITKNPCAKIEKIKEQKTKKKAFTEIEIEKLRDALRNNREKAIFETLLSTWCRVSELVQMKKTDIDGHKILVHGKGEKDRIVYLNAKAMLALEKYLEERKDSNPYIFPGGYFCKNDSDMATKYQSSKQGEWHKNPELVTPDKYMDRGTIEQLMRRIKKRAGITTDCHPHKFRRTGATMALRKGMPLEQVSRMLGHESIATTQIYLDLSEQDLEANHKKYVT